MQNKYWQALIQHQQAFTCTLPELFLQDKDRFQNFSLEACDILFDYSKQRVQRNTLGLLCALAEGAHLHQYRQDLFSGERINQSERQPALHSALRDSSLNSTWVEGNNVKADIQAVLYRLEVLSESIRQQRHLGSTAKPIRNIICLGIGGSELGPSLLCQALNEYKTSDLQMHFISNVDAKTLTRVLKQLNPESTFCIISSKTFTTPETLQNAKIVKEWFQTALKTEANAAKHLIAVTAAVPLASAFGILPENIFEIWPWVGGRYSVWSAVGLPAILSMGMDHFKAFLAGAYEMDLHFQTAALQENMPVIMALLGIWNRNFWNYPHQAIIPYDDGLEKLPAYIQQLEMESNGKSVNQQGKSLSYATAPLIWGGVGCNGQHAFMQLLHQGTDTIPVDFLIAVKGEADLPSHQKLLLANCFAQSKALMEGYSCKANAKEKLSQAQQCPGDRPSSTLIYPKLTPKILGSLLALFEHKVFVQGAIWGINSFDQWGVELGKKLAKNIVLHLEDEQISNPSHQQSHINAELEKQMDSSTRGLLQFVKNQSRKID